MQQRKETQLEIFISHFYALVFNPECDYVENTEIKEGLISITYIQDNYRYVESFSSYKELFKNCEKGINLLFEK